MSDVLFDLSDKVLTITLNKPDKLNPVGDTMTMPAIERIKEAVIDSGVGAIVLTGAGRAFCAGGDVSNMGVPDTYEGRV